MVRGRPRKMEIMEDAPVEVESEGKIDEKPQETADDAPIVEPVDKIESEHGEKDEKTSDCVVTEVKLALVGGMTRNGPPTIVRFSAGFGNFDKTVILPVSFMSLEAAWEKYKSMVGPTSPEKFLNIVYQAFNMDIPRIYCSIPEITLK